MDSQIAPPEIRLSVESRLEHVFLIGRAVRGICLHLGFNDSEAFQIELCAVEAVNNAIIHAYCKRSGHRVDVVFTANPDNITIEISHGGRTSAALMRTDPGIEDTATECLSENGRGLHIMRQVMDEIRYGTENGRNVLMMKKKRSAQPQTA